MKCSLQPGYLAQAVIFCVSVAQLPIIWLQTKSNLEIISVGRAETSNVRKRDSQHRVALSHVLTSRSS